MTVIDRAAEFLADTNCLHVLRGEGTLQVQPMAPVGFPVGITEHSAGFTVFYDGWHEEFDDADTALRCFAWGLSTQTRPKVISVRSFAYRWTAETLVNGEWGPASTTGLLLWPFWGRSKIEYQQNHIVADPDAIG